MSELQPGKKTSGRFLILLLVLGGALALLCHDAFKPRYTIWSNDGPLGYMQVDSAHVPSIFFGHWSCENWVGGEWPVGSPNLDTLSLCFISPETFLKIFAPMSMLVLGVCFWVLFRQLGFSAPACILGGLAAGLNMHFFSTACWGLGVWALAAGMAALAMAALVSPNIKQVWAKAVFAGLAIGMCVMEGFDVGAILSIYVGVFLIYYFWITRSSVGNALAKITILEVIVVAVSALFAFNTISGLFSVTGLTSKQLVSVSDDSSKADDVEKDRRWTFTTQWSTPKIETLGVFVSGLFGYRLQEYTTDQDKSGIYWGHQGEDLLIDKLESSDPKVRAAAGMSLGSANPAGVAQVMESDNLEVRNSIVNQVKQSGIQIRHTGSGEYIGVTVVFLALFAVFDSFRRKKSLFSLVERKMVWFFAAAAAISLISAWGRYSFFYAMFWYRVPAISNIRNPIKFMNPLDISLLILAGYGMESLCRRYAEGLVGQAKTWPQRWRAWWKSGAGFDKAWLFGSLALVAVGLAAVIFYNGAQPKLIAFLQSDRISPDLAPSVAAFSVKAAFWGLVFLALSVGVMLSLLMGMWPQRRAFIGWGLLGVILIVDLGRSDIPWVRYFDVSQKYSDNLIVDLLKDKPYEHRIVGRTSPMAPSYDLSADGNLGGLCHWWMENDYPYNNIQNLEIDQSPRMPEIDRNVLGRFMNVSVNVPGLPPNELVMAQHLAGGARLWKLTNTKYVLCDPELVPYLNQFGDPVHNSFHTIGLYHIIPKANVPLVDNGRGQQVPRIEDAGDLTLWPVDQKSQYFPLSSNAVALVQFDGALPRAKLYSNWTIQDNPVALDTIGSADFDADHLVVISKDTPVSQKPAVASPDPGAVNITHYQSTDIKLNADAKTDAVLMLNERYLPPGDSVGRWDVFIDGKPGDILRCDYIMRGVALPPGHHEIEFHYVAYLKYLYVSLTALLAGLLTAGYVVYTHYRKPLSPAPAASRPEAKSKAQHVG